MSFPTKPLNDAAPTELDGPQPEVDDDSDILPLPEFRGRP